MLTFCGIDRCVIDANGRLKFSPKVLDDFKSCGGDIVLHCLPEGAVAVYPEEEYLRMRKTEEDQAVMAGKSLVYRRQMRYFGAWTSSETISAQGRITLPAEYRELAGLDGGTEAVVVGTGIGVEIWNRGRWNEEQKLIMKHAQEKGENEMLADLNRQQ